MKLYELLGLDRLECQVAIIKNAYSVKKGKKDIIKIADSFEVNLDIIGYVDPGATVNIIQNGKLVEKKDIHMPYELTNVIKCRNPRCITSVEQELPHRFRLTEKKKYRCIYCETEA